MTVEERVSDALNPSPHTTTTVAPDDAGLLPGRGRGNGGTQSVRYRGTTSGQRRREGCMRAASRSTRASTAFSDPRIHSVPVVPCCRWYVSRSSVQAQPLRVVLARRRLLLGEVA